MKINVTNAKIIAKYVTANGATLVSLFTDPEHLAQNVLWGDKTTLKFAQVGNVTSGLIIKDENKAFGLFYDTETKGE